MPDLRPDPSGVHAVALTCCPLLAAHLADLHPAIRTGLLTRIAGDGMMPDTDGLLRLTRRSLNDDASPAGDAPTITTTVYIGTDLDDAGVWDRAVKLRASHVLFSPSDDDKLIEHVQQHLQTNA